MASESRASLNRPAGHPDRSAAQFAARSAVSASRVLHPDGGIVATLKPPHAIKCPPSSFSPAVTPAASRNLFHCIRKSPAVSSSQVGFPPPTARLRSQRQPGPRASATPLGAPRVMGHFLHSVQAGGSL